MKSFAFLRRCSCAGGMTIALRANVPRVQVSEGGGNNACIGQRSMEEGDSSISAAGFFGTCPIPCFTEDLGMPMGERWVGEMTHWHKEYTRPGHMGDRKSILLGQRDVEALSNDTDP